MNVFYDAGLLFESSLVTGTKYRKGETLTQNRLFISLPTMLKLVHVSQLHCNFAKHCKYLCVSSSHIFCFGVIPSAL